MIFIDHCRYFILTFVTVSLSVSLNVASIDYSYLCSRLQ